MKYNAFFGELPIHAFKPRPSGGMTLEGGGNPVSAVTDAISNVVSGVGDIAQGAVNTVGDVGQSAINAATANPALTAAVLAAATGGLGGLAEASALDATGADIATGGMAGVAPTAALAAPSALDVSGADMVTGEMPGVASTGLAALPVVSSAPVLNASGYQQGGVGWGGGANTATTPLNLGIGASPADVNSSLAYQNALNANSGFTADLPNGYTSLAQPSTTSLATLASAPAMTISDAGAGLGATSLADIGSGTLATPGDVGTQFVTQATNPATVGQITDASLSGLSPAAVAGTGAAGAGLLGAATTASGDLVPATLGLDAGTAAAGAAAGAGLGTAAGGAMTLADILPYTTSASVISGLLGANASTNAAQIQADAANKALAQQQANFNTINQQQAPYRASGYNALNNIGQLGSGTYQMYDASGNPTTTGTGTGYLQHQFNAQDLAAGLAPNYDFMLNQGQMTNQRAANVGGGALSGNTLQGLQKYTQDYAGNAYQNAFNNYQTQRNNIYNTLAGIAGIGQTGQTAANTASTNLANAASQLGVGSAAAQAAGQTGATNAYTNAIGNVANNYTLASLLNQGGSVAA
jgi:hypothetical protein